MTHLVIGNGQVGQAIAGILKSAVIDKGGWSGVKRPILHICFPYSRKFVRQVRKYIAQYNPDLIIIHSTVKVGTSEKIGAVYSPIRGVHPNLIEGIRTFVKYFGGDGADEAAKIFKDLGIKTKVVKDSRSVEAMKLIDTTYYGWALMFEKWVKGYCDKNGLDFDLIYRHANETYNIGYKKLKMSNVVRPVYKDMAGKIGGHCVIQNTKLLKGFIPALIIRLKNLFL